MKKIETIVIEKRSDLWHAVRFVENVSIGAFFHLDEAIRYCKENSHIIINSKELFYNHEKIRFLFLK